MTDSVTVFSPLWRCEDANGSAVSGAKLKFYDAGTTTPKTVYSDSGLSTALGTTVTCDAGGAPANGAGTKTQVYVGSDAYKLIITDADDATLATFDNVQGALNTTGFGTGTGSGDIPVDTATADRTLGVDDKALLLNCDPTGGVFTITLTSAVTLGDGWWCKIRHDGTANQVKIATVSGQSIKLPGGATAAGFGLVGKGHSVTIVCDGAGFTVSDWTVPYVGATIPFTKITSRLTSPPASPNAGARYLLTGTPTGDWAAYAADDIVEADGQGTWTRYTPFAGCGWLVWIESENLNAQYQASSWVDWSRVSETSTTVPRAIYEHNTSQNTSGGSLSSVTWNTAPWTTEISDTIGCSVSSNQITIPAGTYRISAFRSVFAPANQTTQARIRLYDVTNSAVLAYGTTQYMSMPSTTAATSHVHLVSDVTLSASTVVRVEVYASNATNWGTVLNVSGISEYWGRLEITDLNGYRGATGPQGATGNDGADAGFKYTFDSGTSGSGISSGNIRGNNATLASITQLFIHKTDADSTSLGTEIETWDDSTSSSRAKIKVSNSSGMITCSVTGALTDNTTYYTIPVTVTASRGSLTGTVRVSTNSNGDKGDTGATGLTGNTGLTGSTGATGPNVGLDYTWSTGTGTPNSGEILVDNATPASATTLKIHETNRLGSSQAACIATWDDSTTPSDKGLLRIIDVANPGTNYLEYRITSTLTDAGSYDTFPVTYVGGAGTIANGTTVAVMWFRTGDKGSDGAGSGDVSAASNFGTDNVLIRSDGTSKGVQATGISVADATNDISGTGFIKPANNDGGALGDTTHNFSDLFLASGGVINWNAGDVTITHASNALAFAGASSGYSFDAVIAPATSDGAAIGSTTLMWSDLFLASGAVINFNNGNATITHSTGLLTISTALSIGTSNAFTAGTIELGAASDTTLSRSAAGELAVEGTIVKKVGKETIWIPAAAMTARTTNGAATGTAEMTTNKNMFSTLDFDTTTQEFAQFAIRMPKSWNESTITAAFTWSHASTTTNFGVVWALEGIALSDGDAGDTAFGTAQQVADTGGTTNTIYVTSATSAITIGGTPAAEDWVIFQVKRVPSDGSDTMAIDARLHGVTLYYTTDASTDA